jgi:NAD-dependent dihydropyrimidine dehydrogenase PreA subunit
MSCQIWVPQINTARCSGCNDCVGACPTHTLGLVENKARVINPQACTYCLLCEDICPTHAIRLPLLILMGSTR